MDALPPPARLRRSNTFSPAVAHAAPRLQRAAWDDQHCVSGPPSPAVFAVKTQSKSLAFVYDSDDAREQDEEDNQREARCEDSDVETEDSQPATPPDAFTPPRLRRKVTIFETPAQSQCRERRLPRRRNSADALGAVPSPVESLSTPTNNQSSHATSHAIAASGKLSDAQKRGCFQYIKRRHSTAMAFASIGSNGNNSNTNSTNSNNSVDDNNLSGDALSGEQLGSHWEFVKAKHGVDVFKSTRSRCEIRGVTRVNASVKNVMSLLAAGESTESFAHAQNILLGRDQVLEARVLASCVPSSASRYFHCGLKYMAIKNPFGLNPLDLVFLDYTDVSTTPDGKLIGYRILESIRVPEFRSTNKYTRASLRCEVYIVRETDVPGVVEVSFASHLDPKSKYFASKRHTWLDQIVVRLTNLRSYAEKASFSHRLLLEKGNFVKGETRHHCSICETNFSFLRKRHNCRLCGEVTCGRCSRKLPVFVGTETTRVRVCLGCMIQSRRQPDELGRLEITQGRRNSIGNATYIAYDEIEDVCDDEHEE